MSLRGTWPRITALTFLSFDYQRRLSWQVRFLAHLFQFSIVIQQAPKTRDPNPSGLGRAIINRKVKDARRMQESGMVRPQAMF